MTIHPRKSIRILAAAAVLALASLTAACSVNPATGRSSFTGFMSEGDERQVGQENHPKILEEFGGTAGGPELAAYVQDLGSRLAATSERPDLKYTFTVLNSPIVNAFAVPGGYIYVTRGLLALANDEAELGGVIAHEIGHITARHSAERYSSSILAQIGLIGLGVATGSSELVNLAGTGAQVYLQSYSRDQEFEADMLGVRYLGRSAYDTRAMSAFLSSMQADARLEATIAGNPNAADQFNIMQTHPRTADRVARAVQEAGQPAADAVLNRDVYLQHIDGLLYGDDPSQGFIKGRRFAHPQMKIEFTVPQGFVLNNSADAVVAIGPQGSQIVFDGGGKGYGGDMANYISEVWAKNIQLQSRERTQINGMEAATGTALVNTKRGAAFARLVAIRSDSGTIYRFLGIAPRNGAQSLDSAFMSTASSFRRLSDAEAAALKPMRIRVVTVQPGDSVASLASRMPFEDYREERFRVLNGLESGEGLTAGQRVKLIVE